MRDTILHHSDNSITSNKSSEVHVFMQHSSKMHSDQTDKFLYIARSRDQP